MGSTSLQRHISARSMRFALAAAALAPLGLSSACAESVDDVTDAKSVRALEATPLQVPQPELFEARGTTRSRAALRAVRPWRYLSAQWGGGGALHSSAEEARGFELFDLVDEGGGALHDGDVIGLETDRGFYVAALDNGALGAPTMDLYDGCRFRVIRAQGPGLVRSGDVIGLQNLVTGTFLRAEPDVDVAIDGATFGLAESFMLDVVTPAVEEKEWRLVWNDEFDGPDLDLSKWSQEVQWPGWVNNEAQRYTARPENVRVEDGALILEGRRDWFEGNEFTSGRVKTEGKATWTYGRFEARIHVPRGTGVWSAFWLDPADHSLGWPSQGEMDVLEHVGFDPDIVHATMHTRAFNWWTQDMRSSYTSVPGLSDDFHVYAMEWGPERIDAFVDGKRYFSMANGHTGFDQWAFDQPFYIVMNLAIGGSWGGERGIDGEGWPRQYQVDYVRVYQH